MTLTELARVVGMLRDMPAPERRAAVAGLLPALADAATDQRVDVDTRLNLVTRAIRAVAPRASRPSAPAEALEVLCAALDADRGPGRPPEGSPHTIRIADDVWERVEAFAEKWGVSESKAAARMIAEWLAQHD